MDLSNLLLDSRVQIVDWMFLTRSEMPAEELEGSENVLFIYLKKKFSVENILPECVESLLAVSARVLTLLMSLSKCSNWLFASF